MRDVPTALAPTAELAEPKVKRFAEKLAKDIGGTIHQFYACEPCTNRVWASRSNDSPSWIMGDWGLELRCKKFDHDDYTNRQIDVSFVSASANQEHGMIVILLLSARVMR